MIEEPEVYFHKLKVHSLNVNFSNRKFQFLHLYHSYLLNLKAKSIQHELAVSYLCIILISQLRHHSNLQNSFPKPRNRNQSQNASMSTVMHIPSLQLGQCSRPSVRTHSKVYRSTRCYRLCAIGRIAEAFARVQRDTFEPIVHPLCTSTRSTVSRSVRQSSLSRVARMCPLVRSPRARETREETAGEFPCGLHSGSALFRHVETRSTREPWLFVCSYKCACF